MPVSRDGEVQADLVRRSAPRTATSTTTSPRSVNLMALPTRLTMIWRSRPGSPTQAVGHVRRRCGRPAPAPSVRPGRPGPARCRPGVSRRSKAIGFQLELAGLDLGEVEDVVDQPQQRLGRLLDHVQVLALLRASARCPAASSVMPMMPFIGVRISWLMLARNSLLARLAASAASLASRSSSCERRSSAAVRSSSSTRAAAGLGHLLLGPGPDGLQLLVLQLLQDAPVLLLEELARAAGRGCGP